MGALKAFLYPSLGEAGKKPAELPVSSLDLTGVAAVIVGNNGLRFFIGLFKALSVALLRFFQPAKDEVIEINFHALPT
jgi:hypothetical protein